MDPYWIAQGWDIDEEDLNLVNPSPASTGIISRSPESSETGLDVDASSPYTDWKWSVMEDGWYYTFCLQAGVVSVRSAKVTIMTRNEFHTGMVRRNGIITRPIAPRHQYGQYEGVLFRIKCLRIIE